MKGNLRLLGALVVVLVAVTLNVVFPASSFADGYPPGQSPAYMTNMFSRGAAGYPSSCTRSIYFVRWRNDDSAPHTTTSGSCSGNVCSPMPGWDSGILYRGQSFSHRFNTAGTFHYYCRIHGAMMQGSVVVMP